MLFDTIEISSEDQYPNCLAACSAGPMSLPAWLKILHLLCDIGD